MSVLWNKENRYTIISASVLIEQRDIMLLMLILLRMSRVVQVNFLHVVLTKAFKVKEINGEDSTTYNHVVKDPHQ